jgi:monothiol glutaredoxin
MSLTPEVRQQLDDLVNSNDVVLFMKGNRNFPQCGFSATLVDILNELVDDYETVNVLSDPAIRQGIKDYTDWPTIPQLYIKGEFVGGCDIVRELHGSGELHTQLGVEEEEVAQPTITITDAAAEVVGQALAAEEGAAGLQLSINSRFQYDLSLSTSPEAAFTVKSNGVTLLLDRGTAKRANGITLDYIRSASSEGFSITNPNEPPKVQQMNVTDLKTHMDEGAALSLFDVRSEEERAIASIEGALMLDEAAEEKVIAMDKDAMLVFHCHKGGRSQQAAEYFLSKGFTNVHNVEGGIDAWAATVDKSLERY